MTDGTEAPRIDFGDPDKLIRVGDLLSVLEMDRDLARTIAEHHGLIGPSSDEPVDKIEVARWICWILVEAEREQTRKLLGDARAQAALSRPPMVHLNLAERLQFLSRKPQAAESGNFHGR